MPACRLGGASLKVLSEMLGHSTIGVAANIYTSALPELAREAAEGAARLVPRTSRDRSGPISVPSRRIEQVNEASDQDEMPAQSGGRGIRTHEELAPLAVFKTAAIGH